MNVKGITPVWLRDLQYTFRRAGSKVRHPRFSNFDEQQIIDHYIDQFGIRREVDAIVDVGAGDGIRNSNTYHLFSRGWRGIGIEADAAIFHRLERSYRHFQLVTACHEKVTPDNIRRILAAKKIERDFGILSLDIDGNDYWVLDSVLAEFRPRLIVSEYNEKIPPPIKFVIEFNPDFRMRHHFFGYSIAQLEDLLHKHDYVILRIEYNNVFLAPAELADSHRISANKAYRDGYSARVDRKKKFPENNNLEALHTLDPHNGIAFLNAFFSEHQGKYRLGLGKIECAEL